jgi:glycosyltransferase involved in cell wall biosynthesis
MRISIVIPAYNEEKAIGQTLVEVKEALARLGEVEHEIIVVDNNSTDATAETAKKAGAKVVFEGKRGYGRAYKKGLAEAAGEVIITGDADCTYPFGEIPRFLGAIESNKNAFITANRFAKPAEGSMSFTNWMGNCMLTLATNLLYRTKISDSQSGMWVFRREFLKEIDMDIMSDGMPFSQEIKIYAARKGLEIIEIPIEYQKRVGKAKLSTIKDGWNNLKGLVTFKKRLEKAVTKP